MVKKMYTIINNNKYVLEIKKSTFIALLYKVDSVETVNEYLKQVRIKRAEELIVNSAKSFKEISIECGFYDQNYFSKTFTLKNNCSPTEYRKKFTVI